MARLQQWRRKQEGKLGYILLWALATYPPNKGIESDFAARRAALTPPGRTNAPSPEITARLTALDNEEAGAMLRQSFAGRIGRGIEPVLAPLGFDWKMGIGIVASFAAREVFVSTMSTVYNVGSADKSESSVNSLARTLREQKRPDGSAVYTPLTAVSLMVFYVFALQCVSTVAIVRRETNSWKWPFFQWLYMGLLAWGFAFATFQIGRWLGWS